MSGFSRIDQFDLTRYGRQRGSIATISLISLCELIELTLLVMVITSSWLDYRKSNRSCSVFGFFQNLTTMRKCFLGCGSLIFVSNSLYWIQVITLIDYNDEICSLLVKITGRVSFSVPMAIVYLCLWVRQYLLHQSPVLRTAIPKWFFVLSKNSLILTVIALILPPAADVSYKNNQLTWGPAAKFENGSCYFESAEAQVWFPILTGCISILTQISYMVLFYKTLKLHQENNKNAIGTNNQESKLNQLAKRCFYFTLITVLTDCLCYIIVLYTVNKPTEFVQGIGKVDLMMNMVCLMFCFNKLPNAFNAFLRILSCGKWKTMKEESDNSINSRA